MIETSYPYCYTMCEQPKICQLYQFIRNVYDPRRDNAYAPAEKRTLESVYVDETKKSVDDMMMLLYGRHVCTVKEIRQCQIDRNEYRKMKATYNVDTVDFLYEFCKNRWFRCLFAMIPDEETDIVVSSWQKAQELGVMHKYFGLANCLDIPLESDRDVRVVIDYSDDYEDFAIGVLGESSFRRQMAVYKQANDIKVVINQNEFSEVPQLIVIADVIVEERLQNGQAVDLEVLDYQRDQMMMYLKKRVTNDPHLENASVVRVQIEDEVNLRLVGPTILVTRQPSERAYLRSVYRNPYYFYFNYGKFEVPNAPGADTVFISAIANKVSPEEIGSLVAFSKYKENYERYLLARKVNGQRAILVFLDGFCGLVRRNGVLGCVHATYSYILEKTVCDVEICDNVVYILDVFSYRGKDCTHMSFHDRMAIRIKILGAVAYVSRYRMAIQQYLLPVSFRYLCQMVDYKKSDGIVFVPIERFGGRVRLRIFKWKPNGDTVDFKVVSRNDETWLCVLGDQKAMVPIEQVVIDEFYEARIVECYRDNGSWVFYRVRNDKIYPNTIRTYNDILQFSQRDLMGKFMEAMLDWIDGIR